jgi:hypothetical protein
MALMLWLNWQFDDDDDTWQISVLRINRHADQDMPKPLPRRLVPAPCIQPYALQPTCSTFEPNTDSKALKGGGYPHSLHATMLIR